MVAGRLQEKKGLFYMVLSYTDKEGNRKQPWFPTGLAVKGNKKRSEKMLIELRSTFKIPQHSDIDENILFADYLEEWLEIAKSRVKIATYSSYSIMIKSCIAPYFREKNIKLKDLEARHIQGSYTEQLQKVKPNKVIHYHANIHSALKYAVRTDRILVNPADKIDRPKFGTRSQALRLMARLRLLSRIRQRRDPVCGHCRLWHSSKFFAECEKSAEGQ